MPGAWGVHGKPPLLTARGRAPSPSPPRIWRPSRGILGPRRWEWERRGGEKRGGREGAASRGGWPSSGAALPGPRLPLGRGVPVSLTPRSCLGPLVATKGGSRRGRQAWVAVCAPRCPWCECGLPKHKPLRASSVSGTSGPRTATSSCGSRRWAGHELAALSLGLWCDGSWSRLRTTRTDSVQAAKGGSGQPRSPRPPCLLRRVSAGPAAAPPPTAGSGRVQGHWGRGFWLYEVRRAPRLPCHPGGFIALVLEPVLSLVRTEKGA